MSSDRRWKNLPAMPYIGPTAPEVFLIREALVQRFPALALCDLAEIEARIYATFPFDPTQPKEPKT